MIGIGSKSSGVEICAPNAVNAVQAYAGKVLGVKLCS